MATARLNHNAHLAEIHRTLSVHHADQSKQIGKLASGRRVNRPSDDPASVALADGIRSEVRSITEGARNIQQTFSLIQVADGSLNEISAAVNRMRSLSMQAASSVFSDENRLSISAEFSHLREEIDRIASATTYNGRRLLTGGNNVVDAGSTALVESSTTGFTALTVADAEPSTFTFGDSDEDGFLTLGNDVQSETVDISAFLVDGAVPAGAHFAVRFKSLGIEFRLTGADLTDAPGEYRAGALDGQQIVVSERDSLTFQVGPSGTSNDVSRVAIRDMTATGPSLNLGDLSIATRVDAQQTLDRLSVAIQAVSAERNRLGAFQRRLQLSIATSQSVIERMVDTEAQIREIDVARAASRLARSQILAEAATSIAGEADTDIERILTLLR